MLIRKTQVYRHLLFNRLGRSDDELDVRSPKPHPKHSILLAH